MTLNKTILIITEQKIKTVQLHNIENKYLHVFWSKNSMYDVKFVTKNIKSYIASYFYNVYEFFKKSSLNKID